MDRDTPQWLKPLNDEDLQFLKRLLLASGSLKALAKEYGISYPTVRNRLDRLIEKVRAADNGEITDPLVRQVRVLVADGQLAPSAARVLLDAYRAAGRAAGGVREGERHESS